MSDSPILPNNFHGEWKVLTQAWPHQDEQRPRHKSVRIEHQSGSDYLVSYDGRNEWREMSYEEATDTLSDEDHHLCISFWRNPSTDVIFGCRRGKTLWAARREPRVFTGVRPTMARLCRPWHIKMTSGAHGAEGTIEPRYLDAGDAPLHLLGLFHLEASENGAEPRLGLYDVLLWDERVKSFNSVFGVRSLNYWNVDPENPDDDCLFATFNNRSSIPATHIGEQLLPRDDERGEVEHKLGQLMPFERRLVAAAHTDLLKDDAGGSATEESEADDPDVGVWVGEP